MPCPDETWDLDDAILIAAPVLRFRPTRGPDRPPGSCQSPPGTPCPCLECQSYRAKGSLQGSCRRRFADVGLLGNVFDHFCLVHSAPQKLTGNNKDRYPTDWLQAAKKSRQTTQGSKSGEPDSKRDQMWIRSPLTDLMQFKALRQSPDQGLRCQHCHPSRPFGACRYRVAKRPQWRPG